MNQQHSIPDIVETIKKERITPIPRWILIAKNVAFWALLGGMGIIGVLFLSLGLIDILDIGPEIFHSFGFRRLPFFLFLSTPLVWIGLFGLAVIFGILTFRNTKHGYRYRTLFVGSLITLAILTATLLAHFARLDERLDRAFESGTPEMFRGILPPRASRWSSPQDGALVGEITETRSNSFLLQAPNTKIWTVFIQSQTRISPNVHIESGENVLVLGTSSEDNSFQALFIRPLRDDWQSRESDANSPSDAPYKNMRGAHDRFNH
ncbi:MAG: hypothetical protein WBC29_00010 [Candidatus Moraniibacteriota bacterium]